MARKRYQPKSPPPYLKRVQIVADKLGLEVDDASRKAIVEKGQTLGCVWQIFHPADADKIRDYLNGKRNANIVGGGKTSKGFDAIHEGNVKLGKADLAELKKNYAVEPFNVLQFVGEGVFIPAGAPRQVK